MKRWQDRGEVEDSEDEELSLELESESPERPRKRAKHSQEPETVEDEPIVLLPKPSNIADSENGEELDWIQPKVAKTYSRKTRVQHKTTAELERSKSDATNVEDTGDGVSEPVQSASQDVAASPEQPTLAQQTIPSSISEDLPDLNPVPNISQLNERGQSMSAASSPLSERDVSPPADFHFPERLPNVRDVAEERREASDDDIADYLAEDHLPQSTAIRRRNLRARKAIQLNPYQYDLAQYKTFCRSRGLKPIRISEQQRAQEEAESQSQTVSSPAQDGSFPPSSPRTTQEQPRNRREGLDYFDVGNSSDLEPAPSDRSPKRRKLAHRSERDKNAGRADSRHTTRKPNSRSQLDEVSVPPSPPRTSSDLSNADDAEPLFRETTSGFRIPLGLTPAALPTPQISSDAKRNDDDDSVSDSPPRRSRPSTLRRHARSLSVISVNSDSEEAVSDVADVESELEARRLRREQKRIKGVLPASWLKIDLQAQQKKQAQETKTQRRLSTASPAKAEAQKGVARKIGRTVPRDHSPDLLDLPGGTSDSDGSEKARSLSRQQSRLHLGPDRFAIDLDAAVDDDLMENDFVDPMLAGSSRQKKTKGRRIHQPRINEVFRNSAARRDDFSEERRAYSGTGRAAKRSQAPKGRNARRSKRKAVVHLSIADAPSSPSAANQHLPQFVRLALRQTRHAPDRGRHSPTNKVVHLATAEDTEEASSMLRAWREGTIAPRSDHEDSPVDDGIHMSTHNLIDYPSVMDAPQAQRQQVFPTPTTQRKKSNHGTHHPVRRQRPQQTRLQPVELRGDAHRSESAANAQGDVQPAVRRKARRPQQLPRLRDAQIETRERDFDENHREAMFERRMQCMTESVARPLRQSRGTGFQLERFLQTDDVGAPGDQAAQRVQQNKNTDSPNPNIKLAHRPRKPTARRLDVETRQYRQPSEPLPQEFQESESTQTDVDVDSAQPVLQGLQPFGTRYPVDFDARPLDANTFFHSNTFIGSGDFNVALNLSSRDLETGLVRIYVEGEVFEWGAWNEDVATEVTRVPTLIFNMLRTLEGLGSDMDIANQVSTVDGNVRYLLRSVIRYCSKCVWFTDPVDRQSCVERLNDFTAALSDILSDECAKKANYSKIIVRALQLQVVIAKQAVLLSGHYAVSPSWKRRAEELLVHSARKLVRHGIADRFAKVRSFYEDNSRAAVREAGIQDDSIPFASLVLLRHVLSEHTMAGTQFWQVVSGAFVTSVDSICNVKMFEQLWQNVFTILPAMELDATGIVRTDSRFTARMDDWSLIKAIINRILELYEPSSQIRGYSVNEYVRITLARCYCLINKWGWWRCEPVLNTIFDFFAQRSFSLLHKEESRGSPKFLEDLGSPDVALEVTPDDCSFHAFLKMLATGLLGMRKYHSYDDRKIQRIIWRFIPNHNRVFRKDSDLQKSDLEALRNQHDLFSILYFASPPKERLSVDLVLGLVDHSTSHREACRLSVRAWANIASYQASTSEPTEALEELTGWFCNMIKTTLAQYRLAKTEAEQDFDKAKYQAQHSGETTVDEGMLETIIASNQRQIAAIVIDALAGLKRTIRAASSLSKVQTLVERTCFSSAFDLFDPSQRRLLTAMQEALLVCDAALDMHNRLELVSANLQADNDDSQDFGDSSALEAFAANDQTSGPAGATIADALLSSVGQFLSNVFGADAASEDLLLQQVIDLWTRLASVTVRSSAKSWSSYVDDYGTTAWSQLRDTAQKRKFTPYFMSQILVRSNGDEEVRESVTLAWLLSLVEREAMLKFQHCLTSALLNYCGDEPLLSNLPFTRERTSGLYEVTLSDLRQRRVALISSVLCNMRTHHDEVSRESSSRGQELRSRYASMLRQLMQSMKVNYRDLQAVQSGTVADPSIQGGYVDFVQHVVSFLQQYAIGVCQIDRFFTDSAAFPLPATDPTYVVGRLRSYIPKLAESSGRAQLAMFIQTVSERAAIDSQQQYLVNQMAAAMNDSEEQGDEKAPTLRHVLLTSIFPAYIANALSTACSWIPVLPMLEACEVVISNLLYNFQVEEKQSVLAVVNTLASVLHSMCLQCDYALVHADLVELPHVVKTLAAMFSVGQACLTITSYIQRATSLGGQLCKRVQTLHVQAIAIETRLQDQAEAAFLDTPECEQAPTTIWPDTRAVAEKQVRESVNAKWHALDGRYLVQRGNAVKEVVVELGDSKDEKTRLLQVIASFRRAFEATFGDPQRTRREAACDDFLDGLVV